MDTTDNKISNWKDATTDYDRKEDGWRFVRTFDENHFLSCLDRLTGFGYREVETALVVVKPPPEGKQASWRDREVRIVIGDRREQFNNMTIEEVTAWYDENHKKNLNTMDAFVESIKPRELPEIPKPEPKSTTHFDNLRAALDRLQSLLKDPEPSLSTWWEAYNNRIAELKELL